MRLYIYIHSLNKLNKRYQVFYYITHKVLTIYPYRTNRIWCVYRVTSGQFSKIYFQTFRENKFSFARKWRSLFTYVYGLTSNSTKTAAVFLWRLLLAADRRRHTNPGNRRSLIALLLPIVKNAQQYCKLCAENM